MYYNQCDEDLQKSIAVLVAATGLHEELVVEARTEGSTAEEKKEDEPAGPRQQLQPAFVSCPPHYRCLPVRSHGVPR